MRLVIIAICFAILAVSLFVGTYPKFLYPSDSKASEAQIAQMEVNAKLCFRDSECSSPCEDKLSCNSNYANIYYLAKNTVECKLKTDNCKNFVKLSCIDNECGGISAK